LERAIFFLQCHDGEPKKYPTRNGRTDDAQKYLVFGGVLKKHGAMITRLGSRGEGKLKTAQSMSGYARFANGTTFAGNQRGAATFL
jgi:hypothetical protein